MPKQMTIEEITRTLDTLTTDHQRLEKVVASQRLQIVKLEVATEKHRQAIKDHIDALTL